MLKQTLALALAALLCLGAAPKPAPRAHKALAAPAASAAPHAGPLDVRDPASLVTLLASLSAKAEIARREGDAVFLTVTSSTEIFSA
ncbi:MAG: hypothetical protein JWQ97_4114, partial [Phenylobacterium sp.]|nr:hypothetical protein [Phenylobacterium sp.]